MVLVLNQIVHGVMLGILYSLIGCGYTLIFGTLSVITFAHGDVCVFGAFILMTILLILAPFGIAAQSWILILLLIVVTIGITGGIGIVIERYTVRPFRKMGHMPMFLGSLATAFILREIIKHFYPQGANPHRFSVILTDLQVEWGGVMIRLSNVIIILIATLLFVVLFWFVNRTRVGLQIRATAEDMEAALMMGVNLDRMYATIYFIASGVGALAGILNGVYFQVVEFNMGAWAGIMGLTAAIFGGLGNVYGAIIGGMILGLVESFTVAFVPGGTPYKETFAFAVVILFLIFKPSGILGKKVVEKV